MKRTLYRIFKQISEFGWVASTGILAGLILILDLMGINHDRGRSSSIYKAGIIAANMFIGAVHIVVYRYTDYYYCFKAFGILILVQAVLALLKCIFFDKSEKDGSINEGEYTQLAGLIFTIICLCISLIGTLITSSMVVYFIVGLHSFLSLAITGVYVIYRYVLSEERKQYIRVRKDAA